MPTNSVRPICGFCTRSARTVDTPNVKVRVEKCTVLQPPGSQMRAVVFCHGDSQVAVLPAWVKEESQIEEWEVFRG